MYVICKLKLEYLIIFRRSIVAVERERSQLTIGYTEEEKFRAKLWKVDKIVKNETVKCQCGLDISFKYQYDQAELQKDKLPVARMKLEALLKDVQESYCHHQHVALLAHCQVGT
jgi:hypothetical protein